VRKRGWVGERKRESVFRRPVCIEQPSKEQVRGKWRKGENARAPFFFVCIITRERERERESERKTLQMTGDVLALLPLSFLGARKTNSIGFY